MGIDPVTHSPRLDLLDLSSILSSSLYNSSSPHDQMNNMTRLLGHPGHIVNPELLKLATSLMSSTSHRSNHNNFFLQNAHHQDQNLIFGSINDNYNNPQFQQLNVQGTSTASTNQYNFQAPLGHHHHHHQEIQACPTLENPNNVDLSNLTSFSSPSSQMSEWHSSTFNEDCVPLLPSYSTVLDPNSSETSATFGQSNQNNFGFATTSVLSTPSSSPTAGLNSNSTTTYLNSGSTEDEREIISYCSDMLKFEISDILDVNYEFM